MALQPVSGTDPLRSPDYMMDIDTDNEAENTENLDNDGFKDVGFEIPDNQNRIQSAGNQIDCEYTTPPEPIKKVLRKANIDSLAEFGIDVKSRVHCCDLIDNIFKHENYNDYTIEIPKAEKINDFFGKSYIVYTVQTIEKNSNQVLLETKRRYSEFDMLQKHLIARFPTFVVPPIPGKSNLIEYATGSGKNQKDTMVEKRKRMLQTFLNKLRKHPVFSSMHIVHLFVQSGAQWSSKQDIADLKEGIDEAVACIDEPRLNLIKDKLTLCLKYITFMYNIQSEACKNLQELSVLYSSSGEIYNVWSLEKEPYAPILDQFRETGEALYNKLQSVLQSMENYIIDTLDQYIRYTEIAFGVCKVYRNKFLRLQQINQQLSNKVNFLKHMENENAHEPSNEPTGGIGIENNILRFKNTINSFIDNDPVITRQNNISNTKDFISQLEQDQHSQLEILALASKQVDTDLQRFDKERKDDFIALFKQYAILHREIDAYQLERWSAVKSFVASSSSSSN